MTFCFAGYDATNVFSYGGLVRLAGLTFCYAMDRPLQGAVSVLTDSFKSVYDLVMKCDEPA